MLAFDLVIGILLIFLGISVLIYMLYIVITQRHIKVSPLYVSEALATLFLGVFYVVCACVVTNSGNDTEILATSATTSTTTSTEQAYDPIEEKNLRDLYNPENFFNNERNLTIEEELLHITTNDLIDNFITYYRDSFGNTSASDIRKLIIANRLSRNLQKKADLETDIEIVTNEDSPNEECSVYNEIYYKYIMLVVAFIYGVTSVVNSTIQCKSCTKPTKAEKVFITQTESDEEETPPEYDYKSVLQVLLAWLLPVIYAIIVALTMNTSELPVNIEAPFFEITQAPSDIVNIIEHPLNVSLSPAMNATQMEELHHVIDRIYDIVSSAKRDPHNNPNQTLPFDILQVMNRSTRGLKQIEGGSDKGDEDKCTLEMMPIKLHTLIVFILSYFLSIFYAKLTHTKLSLTISKQEDVKLLGRYIAAFASLWFPSILEVFARTYLMDNKPTVATDLTLALGNLTRLLANGINVRNIHKVIQKFNNVQPADNECV